LASVFLISDLFFKIFKYYYIGVVLKKRKILLTYALIGETLLRENSVKYRAKIPKKQET